MKKTYLLIASLLLVTLSACGQAQETEAIPTVVLEAGSASEPQSKPSSNESVAASAVVVPIQTARLSFTSIGRVTEVNAEVGDKVGAGDAISSRNSPK